MILRVISCHAFCLRFAAGKVFFVSKELVCTVWEPHMLFFFDSASSCRKDRELHSKGPHCCFCFHCERGPKMRCQLTISFFLFFSLIVACVLGKRQSEATNNNQRDNVCECHS
ncbi:membrane-associated protein, putative [Bodo saltans]|uniref:Membrane-associated protein, putative n=1 Tax=Bodo saltans TaxID=75058 RepID=A0A0S4JUL4_BODSA|nr:membrane-associated protein, putative [Bodo saltans]|eukprot:CUG93985.1 membrane-associated protein, putative [Bodo saltans]